ncbi:IS66 family insertion sequence element accessory protein TnpA, partial [Chitinophaga filiformis]
MDQSTSSLGKGSPRPRISVTEKKRLLSEWQQSSLKMKAFCEQNGISLSGLKTWMKQFDMGRKRKSKIIKAPSFVALIPEK